MFNFLDNISPTELIILAAILIFFFGNKITSRLARTSGETVKEIKKIKKEFMEAVNDDDEKTKKT